MAGPTLTRATIKHQATVTMTPAAGGPVSNVNAALTYDQYDISRSLTPTTVPAAKTNAQFLMALVAAAKTLDLTALVDLSSGLVVDGTGNRVVEFRFTNFGAGPMTIVGGAANGYLLFGAAGKVEVPPGGEFAFFTNGVTVPLIDATHKNLDITGTGVETAQVTVITG